MIHRDYAEKTARNHAVVVVGFGEIARLPRDRKIQAGLFVLLPLQALFFPRRGRRYAKINVNAKDSYIVYTITDEICFRITSESFSAAF